MFLPSVSKFWEKTWKKLRHCAALRPSFLFLTCSLLPSLPWGAFPTRSAKVVAETSPQKPSRPFDKCCQSMKHHRVCCCTFITILDFTAFIVFMVFIAFIAWVVPKTFCCKSGKLMTGPQETFSGDRVATSNDSPKRPESVATAIAPNPQWHRISWGTWRPTRLRQDCIQIPSMFYHHALETKASLSKIWANNKCQLCSKIRTWAWHCALSATATCTGKAKDPNLNSLNIYHIHIIHLPVEAEAALDFSPWVSLCFTRKLGSKVPKVPKIPKSWSHPVW